MGAEFKGTDITVGKKCKLRSGVKLITYGGHISIGDNCTVNPYTILYGQGGLEIGDGVRIAAHTTIVPANHIFDDPDTYIYKQGETREGIVIGDDVWIGAGCQILDGVTIGEGSVIGAGSVVTESVPAYSVAVGSPARVIKSRLKQ
ncbi:acyltransferase [Haloferax chudinovii]|uniref:Acyltransferase n=1 Tax=Haloferax chudinovii TaxID=1109010 RepID=A0ABD5XHZ0_9EURY